MILTPHFTYLMVIKSILLQILTIKRLYCLHLVSKLLILCKKVVPRLDFYNFFVKILKNLVLILMSSFLETVESLLKQKGLEQSSINNYVKTIIKLNDNVAPSSGDFLKKTANILDQLNETKNQNTYASKLSAVVSVTKVLAEKYKGFIKPAKAYEAHLKEVVDEKRSSEKDNEGKKTDKQEENWIDWSEVEKIKDDLSKQATEYSLKKHLTAKQFNTVLNNLVLSLYSEVAPRRNKDYQEMVVVNKWNEKMPNDMNLY